MNLPITTQPLDAAVRRLRSKTPVGSRLRSRDWAEMPLALRERAQFSAGVESARVVQGIQDALMEWVTLGKDRATGIPADAPRAFMDRSKFVKELRGLIGAPQGDTGDVKDITSRKRLELIYDFQTEDVYGFGRWKTDNDPEILDGFPAYEFARVEDRRLPRDQVDPGHWQRRFFEAAKASGDDRALAVQRATHRMVALKGSPLWARLSIFGRPWAPFDWGSGMGLVDVDRAEAESLGLLDPGEPVPPAEPEQFNAGLQASVRDLSPEVQRVLQEQFGDQVKVQKGAAWWKGDRGGKKLAVPPKPKRQPGEWPTKVAELELVRRIGGSTGADLMRDPITGDQFVLKRGASEDHLREEFAADQIYRAAGVPVPEARLYQVNGRAVKVARFIQGRTLNEFLRSATAVEKASVLERFQRGFAVDSWLGNWDVAGLDLDNVLVDEAGTPWRIDNGGSLRYRAQGARKTDAQWGPEVRELDSLRDPRLNAQSARVLQGLTDAQIKAQVGDLIARRAEVLAAAPEALRGTLDARLEWMRTRFAKAAVPELDDAMANAVAHSRIVGKSIPWDRDHIEDSQVLAWEEKDTAGRPVTRLRIKLTDAGDAAVRMRLQDRLPALASGAANPDAVDPMAWQGIIISAAKSVNHHAPKGEPANQGKLDAVKGLTAKMNAAAKAGVISKATHEYLKDLQDTVIAAAFAKKAVDHITPRQLRVESQKAARAPETAGGMEIKPGALKYPKKQIRNGHATATDAEVLGDSVKGYDIQIGAVKLTWRPYNPLNKGDNYALQGLIEVEAGGAPTAGILREVQAAMGQIGLKSELASGGWQEALYLWRGIHLRSDQIDPEARGRALRILSDTSIDDGERVRRLKGLVRESMGQSLPEQAGPDYEPEGTANGFGEGWRHWWRWDVPRAEVEKGMRGYVLTHNTGLKMPPVQLLDAWLSQGGDTTPTSERLRKGIEMRGVGMSPDSDLNYGTSNYFFTRIKKAGASADSNGQFHFKVGNLARQDAVITGGDWLENNRYIYAPEVQRIRAKTVPEMKVKSRGALNETLFKWGFNVLDELHEIVARTAMERQQLLDVFARHGVRELNDGRSVESVVRVK